MTPRRPRPLFVPVLLLSASLYAGCGDAPTSTAPPQASPTPTSTAPTATEEPAAGLPDDLALDAGLRRDDSDLVVTGPARDLEGVGFAELCAPDPTLWPGPAVDQVVVTVAGPEYLHVREAVRYPDPTDAVAALDGLREQVRACPEADARIYLLLEPTGPKALTFGMHYREGLGGTVWHLVAHDDVLLVLADSGEASEDSLPSMADGLVRVHDQVWDAIAPQLRP